MQKLSLKALAASILSLFLIALGAAIPANAATNVTPSDVVVAGGNNTSSFTVNLDSLPNSVYSFGIRIYGGSFVTQVGAPGSAITVSASSPTQCSTSGISFQAGASVSGFCVALNSTVNRAFFYATPNNVDPAGTASLSFATGSILFDASAPAGGYRIEAYYQTSSGGGSTTLATIALTTASASKTVTFNSNGGSGAMADQSASAATSLSANAFTRSGYTFAGWNTAADGSGTAYADGASFPFSANATLYAQWTATLATTGFDAAPYLYGGLALALTGGALMLIARRKQSN
jgi:uncharacterized repeat protein (TIGR02543 family)